jgi:hypothetical protein
MDSQVVVRGGRRRQRESRRGSRGVCGDEPFWFKGVQRAMRRASGQREEKREVCWQRRQKMARERGGRISNHVPFPRAAFNGQLHVGLNASGAGPACHSSHNAPMQNGVLR